MLRYRFGFPGIFFLFNVWWGDKFNRQNQSIIYFAIEIRFINFRYWSYYLTRTQGKPVENWGGKFLWSEVALFDVSVFYQTHYLTSKVTLIKQVIRSPSFFSSRQLFDFEPCHPWPDSLFISANFNPDSSCFRKMFCQFAYPSSHAWY